MQLMCVDRTRDREREAYGDILSEDEETFIILNHVNVTQSTSRCLHIETSHGQAPFSNSHCHQSIR